MSILVLALPFSLHFFSKLRDLNCLYVDKTKYAYDLIVQEQSFLLSRPRRFEKSLFLSTLKEILLGKKELFKGLWISESNYKWPVFGVIHLDFSRIDSSNENAVRSSLCQNLSKIATDYELSITLSPSSPNDSLMLLVGALYRKFGKVAILIDEYDHAILSRLYDHKLSEDIEKITALLKSLCSHIPSKLHIPKEKFYHALLIAAFQASGVKTLAEHATADGSIDLVLDLPKVTYVVELTSSPP